MKLAEIQRSFEQFLRQRELKLTAQRRRIFEKAFATHAHFSAETLYDWLKREAGSPVSRATVYRTLSLLVEGGFLESLDTGRGELWYEHVLGHRHHDHMLCLSCGKIEEFSDERIEALQRENCARKGFAIASHVLRISGYCKACQRAGKASAAAAHAPGAAHAHGAAAEVAGARPHPVPRVRAAPASDSHSGRVQA